MSIDFIDIYVSAFDCDIDNGSDRSNTAYQDISPEANCEFHIYLKSNWYQLPHSASDRLAPDHDLPIPFEHTPEDLKKKDKMQERI